MKAVVTGGAGFIGSHLVDELVSNGATVYVADNFSSGRKEQVNRNAICHSLDITSSEFKEFLKCIRPDIVFHQAAQVDVLQSIRNPRHDAATNIVGTVNVLEACTQAAVKKIVYASSCAAYGDLQADLISEDMPARPISYYGISKLTPESYIRVFHQLYGLRYTILRYANVYGPRQTPKGEGGVVSIFLDRIKKKQALHIHGDGEQTRDFVYVKDVAAANLAAISKGDGQIINVGTSIQTSINELIDLLKEIHSPNLIAVHEAERPGDIKHSCLDNRKALGHLSWKPQFPIRQGLHETYKYVMDKE